MDKEDLTFQLYKLEYEKATERYDNIYRSIWTIFSYMTAIAGAILAFGPGKIEPHALICVVFAPLLFWFFTTYLPLDRYGNQVIKRLGQIECIFSRDFHVECNHFKEYHEKELSIREGLRRARKEKSKQRFWAQLKRARFAIVFVFTILIIVFLWQLCGFFHAHKPFFHDTPSEVVPIKVSLDKPVAMAPVKVVIDQCLSAAPNPETAKTAPVGKTPMPRPPSSKQPTSD